MTFLYFLYTMLIWILSVPAVFSKDQLKPKLENHSKFLRALLGCPRHVLGNWAITSSIRFILSPLFTCICWGPKNACLCTCSTSFIRLLTTFHCVHFIISEHCYQTHFMFIISRLKFLSKYTELLSNQWLKLLLAFWSVFLTCVHLLQRFLFTFDPNQAFYQPSKLLETNDLGEQCFPDWTLSRYVL